MHSVRQAPAGRGRSGVFEFEEVDVQLVERGSGVDDRIFPRLAGELFARELVDKILNNGRQACVVAIGDDLAAYIKDLTYKIRFTHLRPWPIGAQLHQEFDGVSALSGDPARVEFWVAVGARLAVVAIPDGRFGSNEQAAVRC
jgi:hypothetical protein